MVDGWSGWQIVGWLYLRRMSCWRSRRSHERTGRNRKACYVRANMRCHGMCVCVCACVCMLSACSTSSCTMCVCVFVYCKHVPLSRRRWRLLGSVSVLFARVYYIIHERTQTRVSETCPNTCARAFRVDKFSDGRVCACVFVVCVCVRWTQRYKK